MRGGVFCGRSAIAAILFMAAGCDTGAITPRGGTGGGNGAGGASGTNGANGAGGTNGNCLPAKDTTQQPVADISFQIGNSLLGSSGMELQVSPGGDALAYAPGTGVFETWRYHDRAWVAAQPFPDLVQVVGGDIGPDGTAHVAWIEVSTTRDVLDIFSRDQSANGVWSDAARVSETGVGMWQKPTIPMAAMVSTASGMSFLLWARIDQAIGSLPSALWWNQHATNQIWPEARPLHVADHRVTGAPGLVLAPNGVLWSAWTSLDNDGTSTVWVAQGGAAGWNAPRIVDQANSDIKFNPDASAPTITTSMTATGGGLIVAYRRSSAAGADLVARHSADGVTWTETETITALGGGDALHVKANNAGAILAVWGSYQDPAALNARFYMPNGGSSPPVVLEGGNAPSARIAMNPDGRAAIAYVAMPTANVNCLYPGVVLRRYAPASGWGAAELVDDIADRITGLGYAGGDLLIAWRRLDRQSYVKVVR